MAFSWTQYAMPSMNMQTGNGAGGTQGFFRPSDSQMMSGTALSSYLTAPGTPQGEMNRTVKFDGGLTREMMGNSTNFLNQQMGTGFGDLTNLINDMGQYGGGFGDRNSPVYSPQSQNGYGGMWGNNNPFKIGSF